MCIRDRLYCFKGLKYNYTLRKLYLNNNQFNKEDLANILVHLKYNSTLTELKFNNESQFNNYDQCKIMEKGIIKLLSKWNRTLNKLSLNKIVSKENKEVISFLLNRNLKLRPLKFQTADCLKDCNREEYAKNVLPKIVYRDCF